MCWKILLSLLFCLPALAQYRQPATLAPRETADGVLFQCRAPGAHSVFLAGTFNQWAQNSGGLITNRNEALTGPDTHGIYHQTIQLPPGVHAYKFVVEQPAGNFTWFTPDYAMHKDEGGNALLIVDGRMDAEEDLIIARPPRATANGVEFEFFAPDAAIVFLAGDFNNWAERSAGRVHDLRFAMRGPDPHGIWRIAANLAPGRYRYQYVIDGINGVADPLTQETSPEGHSMVVVP